MLNFSGHVQVCQYHSASFPVGLEFFVLECLGPGVPTVSLWKTELPQPRFIAILQNNTELQASNLYRRKNPQKKIICPYEACCIRNYYPSRDLTFF